MTELTQIRLVVLLVVAGIVAAWMLARRFARRRQGRFAILAESVGAQVQVRDEFFSGFRLDVDDREFEVRYQHISGSTGAGWKPAWYLVTTTRLENVSDVFSAEVHPRPSRGSRSPASADDFVVRDFGLPLREGWLSPATARLLAGFYELDLPLDRLSIEEGHLVHRSHLLLYRLDGPKLRELLSRQAQLADKLERSL